ALALLGSRLHGRKGASLSYRDSGSHVGRSRCTSSLPTGWERQCVSFGRSASACACCLLSALARTLSRVTKGRSGIEGRPRLLPAIPIRSVTVPSSWHFSCSCPRLSERNSTRPKQKGTLVAPEFLRLHFSNDSA
ncbi:unnamed protein product, partial [Ixodes pacificus]